MPKTLQTNKALAKVKAKTPDKSLKPFIHQRQIVSAPFAFEDVTYFFLCGGYGCGKSFSIVLMIIIICKMYQGEDITVALCSTTITLLQKTVILDLQKICKKTGSDFDYNQKDNIITIGTIRFLLIATGQPNDIYGPNVHITLCLEGKAKVWTKNGYKAIKCVRPGDEVLTRAGWRKVVRAVKQGRKHTITRCGITGTPDHKIPVKGATIELKDLYGHKIFYCSKRRVKEWEHLENLTQSVCRKLSNLTESDITDIQTAKHAISAVITGAQLIGRCIKLYGKKQTEKFQKVISYTTKTKTLSTILLRILSAYQKQNTQHCMAMKKTAKLSRQKLLHLYAMYAVRILKELQQTDTTTLVHLNVLPLQNELLKDFTTLMNMLRRFSSESRFGTKLLVRIAVRYLHQLNKTHNTVLKSVETHLHGEQEKPQSSKGQSTLLPVPYAEKSLNLRTKMLDFAHNTASIFTGGIKTVYDITVEDCHEFLTDKGFVHNCDEIDELPEQKAIEAHKALSERTRITLPNGRKPFIMYFSTTHGYRGLYKIVKKLQRDKLKYVLIRGLTKNNTSLDPQYVKNLYAIYDENERLAYLEGMFVNLQSGRVYASYDEATCKCKPFEITRDMTVYVGQDLNSGFSKAAAVIKKDKVLYIVRGWSFKEVGGAPAIMRQTYAQNEILWFPDCSGKEILKGYKQEILDNGIECRIGSSNPRILDRVFYVNKLFKMGLLKVFDCKETDMVSEALKVRAYNDLGQPEKGKGEDAPDHICDGLEYVIYRIVRSDPDFMQLKELSRENVKENGYLNITGKDA